MACIRAPWRSSSSWNRRESISHPSALHSTAILSSIGRSQYTLRPILRGNHNAPDSHPTRVFPHHICSFLALPSRLEAEDMGSLQWPEIGAGPPFLCSPALSATAISGYNTCGSLYQVRAGSSRSCDSREALISILARLQGRTQIFEAFEDSQRRAGVVWPEVGARAGSLTSCSFVAFHRETWW